MSLDWMDRAACRGMDPAMWFADRGPDRAQAIRICGSCPVAQSCLEAALDLEGATGRHYRYGVAGGLTASQRAKLPRVAVTSSSRAPCGTPAAARRHARAGESLDEACRAAVREYRRDMARRRAAAA